MITREAARPIALSQGSGSGAVFGASE
jgi:hypothetical protein